MRALWLLVALSTVSSAVAQPQWSADQVIQSSGSFNWAKAIAVSPKDRSIWVLATDQKAIPEVDELWRLDAGGQDLKTVPITPKLDRFENVLGITETGDVYLVGLVRDRMHLVKVNSSGTTSFVRPLEPGSAHPLGVAITPQHGLLLFGDRVAGAYASRIDEDGRKLWSIDIDKKPLAATFEAGVALEDGSTILVGNVWDFKQGNIGMGLGDTLIVKVDAKGAIVQQKTFPGRIATGALAGDGNILVVDDPQSYSGATSPGMAAMAKPEVYEASYMRLQSWTPDLKLAWSVKLPEFHVQFLTMSAIPSARGGVVLFGTGRGFTLIASEYDASGHQVWTTTDPARRWGVFAVAHHGDSFVVAHQVYEPDMRIALSRFALK